MTQYTRYPLFPERKPHHRAQKDSTNPRSLPIHRAIIHSDTEAFKGIVEKSLHLINARDKHGNTPLILTLYYEDDYNASEMKQKREILEQHGADYRVKNATGYTYDDIQTLKNDNSPTFSALADRYFDETTDNETDQRFDF